MPASGLALAASAAVRAASLNLCTDEYLLLLANPSNIVSVSHLARDPKESALWRYARRFPVNNGSLEGVLRHRPNLVLTMGGGGRDTLAIARRLRIRVVDLPYPNSIADVERQAMQVSAVLGGSQRIGVLRQRLSFLQRDRPARLEDAAFLSGGGLSLTPQSLGAQWMALAGYRQRPLPTGRLDLETLATAPPTWLIRSDYRSRQFDRGQVWLQHPLVRRLASRTIATDGRRWTCGGLPMIAEVERLQSAGR